MIPRSDRITAALRSLVYRSRTCEPYLRAEAHRKAQKRYYSRNAEFIRAASRRYYRANRQKILAKRAADWREKHSPRASKPPLSAREKYLKYRANIRLRQKEYYKG
jgi:hypothetical protein